MSTLRICLLGKFSVVHDEQALDGLYAFKVRELFCYLLLHRECPHPREMLAGLLWGDSSTAQSKKNLRQTLWHLQTALERHEPSSSQILQVDADWIQINPRADLYLDVALFEKIYENVRKLSGTEPDDEQARAMQEAVEMYKGDLLEGWYQDWCLYKREELQSIYLSLLARLMSYCETQHEYEMGLSYGSRILSYDRASERTHRRLMRLQYLAGDRTAALRQYERCVAALEEELGVKPARSTVLLHEQIRTDQLGGEAAALGASDAAPVIAMLPELLNRLKQLQENLSNIQGRVKEGIRSAELILKKRR